MTADNTADTFTLQEPPMDGDMAAAVEAMTTPLDRPALNPSLVTAEQWATAHGVALRSVRRYLQTGKLPTAVMEGNRWMIPLDAEPIHKAAQTTVARAAAPGQAVARPAQAQPTAVMTLEGELGGQTAYLALDTAARLMGIPADVLVRQREEFGTVRYGDLDPRTRRRAWVVPGATVRRVAGLR